MSYLDQAWSAAERARLRAIVATRSDAELRAVLLALLGEDDPAAVVAVLRGVLLGLAARAADAARRGAADPPD